MLSRRNGIDSGYLHASRSPAFTAAMMQKTMSRTATANNVTNPTKINIRTDDTSIDYRTDLPVERGTTLLIQRLATVPINEPNDQRGEEPEKEAADMHEHTPGFLITHRNGRLWSIWRI